MRLFLRLSEMSPEDFLFFVESFTGGDGLRSLSPSEFLDLDFFGGTTILFDFFTGPKSSSSRSSMPLSTGERESDLMRGLEFKFAFLPF